MKICDFGSARRVKDGDSIPSPFPRTLTVQEHPFYSPECIIKQVVSKKHDIWGLGIIGSELVNGGFNPFVGKLRQGDGEDAINLYIQTRRPLGRDISAEY